jgi:hypothetical protein
MYFQYGPEVSYQVYASSGVANTSGKPQALYKAAFLSGGSAGTLSLFDGTSSLGTFVYAITGTASAWTQENPGVGLVFPNGLFVSFDANVSKATTWARQVLT